MLKRIKTPQKEKANLPKRISQLQKKTSRFRKRAGSQSLPERNPQNSKRVQRRNHQKNPEVRQMTKRRDQGKTRPEACLTRKKRQGKRKPAARLTRKKRQGKRKPAIQLIEKKSYQKKPEALKSQILPLRNPRAVKIGISEESSQRCLSMIVFLKLSLPRITVLLSRMKIGGRLENLQKMTARRSGAVGMMEKKRKPMTKKRL